MIRSLRKRIIAMNVVALGVVFVLAIIIVFSFGYARINEERENRMTYALKFDPSTSETGFSEDNIFRDITLVCYDLSKREVTAWYYGSKSELTEEILGGMIDKVVSSPRTRGGSWFGIFYIKSTDGDTVKIAFNNYNSRSTSLAPYLLMSTLVLVLGLGIYFAVSFLISRVALRPVESTWIKQKQFIADASHELKTPLSVIIANTDIIASHQEETVASQMQWIENTRSEAKRMAVLVNDLLFLAKNDDGLLVKMEDVNLSDCIGTVVLSNEAIFYENNKEFAYSIDPDIHIDGNVGQLQQLVTVLMDNANRYSKGNGNIELKLTTVLKFARLVISNDSEQLTDEQLEHIFDRFYTIDPSRNKAYGSGGNGLGLAIAKMICENHGGSIEVECENGRTTFTAYLPLPKPTLELIIPKEKK